MEKKKAVELLPKGQSVIGFDKDGTKYIFRKREKIGNLILPGINERIMNSLSIKECNYQIDGVFCGICILENDYFRNLDDKIEKGQSWLYLQTDNGQGKDIKERLVEKKLLINHQKKISNDEPRILNDERRMQNDEGQNSSNVEMIHESSGQVDNGELSMEKNESLEEKKEIEYVDRLDMEMVDEFLIRFKLDDEKYKEYKRQLYSLAEFSIIDENWDREEGAKRFFGFLKEKNFVDQEIRHIVKLSNDFFDWLKGQNQVSFNPIKVYLWKLQEKYKDK